MGHDFFNDLHPEVASRETRVIHIVGFDTGIPKGKYPVLEGCCTDPECDCRQVYLHFFNDEAKPWKPLFLLAGSQ